MPSIYQESGHSKYLDMLPVHLLSWLPFGVLVIHAQSKLSW